MAFTLAAVFPQPFSFTLFICFFHGKAKKQIHVDIRTVTSDLALAQNFEKVLSRVKLTVKLLKCLFSRISKLQL